MSANLLRRQGKKRTIAAIVAAMHRKDAIYPPIQENTLAFTGLILFCFLMQKDGTMEPTESRVLKKLVCDQIKLRRDDTEYVCKDMLARGVDDTNLTWLVSFMQTCATGDSLAIMSHRLHELLKMADLMHPAERLTIEQISGFLHPEVCEPAKIYAAR